MKKFFSFLLFCLLFFAPQLAQANAIDKYIKESGLMAHSTVSILVNNSTDGHVYYKKNEKKLLNPASTLKLLTFGSSYQTLGGDYEFETSIYKDSENNLFVKLGADPLLSQNDLNKLFGDFKKKYKTLQIKNIYIDDTIIDKTPYPMGWMEEDVWPNSRKISPYIVDNNFTQIALKRSSLSTVADIVQNDPYKVAVINELKVSDKHSYKILRAYGENSPIITFKGTIAKDELINLPVLDSEINFNIKLRKALDKNDIKYFNKIVSKKMPANACKIVSVSHNIKQVSKNILHNSDNFAAEVVFRVAAAKYINYSHPATLEDAINMLSTQFLIPEGVVIADASGVSRYNLVNSEFLNKVLLELFKDEEFKNLLATSNEGTLKDRLLFLNGNLRAKTGTLSKMSSIAGTLKTKKQNDIVFNIIIQNSPKRKAVLKNFEDSIITILYRKY